MTQGFKATLFAGVITLGVMAPAFAAAPVITDIPDVTIGDLEGPNANEFVYEAPFGLNDFVTYDGDKSTLLWSFGTSELDGLDPNQYTINGVEAALQTDLDVATELSSPTAATLNPSNPISGDGPTTFRDIVLSPTGGGTFPDPTPQQAQDAAAGKLVTYFVSDGTEVASQARLIRSVDNANDTLTGSDGWNVEVVDSDFSSTSWVNSGIASEGVTAGKSSGALTITVSPTSGKGRVYGWQNEALLNYDDVGADRFVRGKFYISTSNDFNDPINEVPGFRLRIMNTAAVDAAAHFEYPQTAIAAPDHAPSYALAENAAVEQYSTYLRPSDLESTPSLYRLDFDPVDVPAAADSPIGALIEAYSYSDTANGTLKVHEVIIGTYDALQEADGQLVFEYDRRDGISGSAAGGAKEMTGGAFNAEANFEDGRRQTLYIPEFGDPGVYAMNLDWTENGVGLVATTRFNDTSLFGMDLLNIESVNNEDKVRIAPNKLYSAKFYALGIMPGASADKSVAVQGPMRFRFQTVGGTLSYLYELIGTSGLGGLGEDGKGDAIAEQAGPSTDSQNPDVEPGLQVSAFPEAKGGWYNLVVPSPLDSHGIRADYEATDATGGGFFDLGSQPAQGSAADSVKDVILGVDLIQAPTHLTITLPEGPALVNYSQPNHPEVGIGAVKVYEYPSIDDGGYDFDGIN